MQTLRGLKYLMSGWLAMDLIMLKEIETYPLLERFHLMDEFLETFFRVTTIWGAVFLFMALWPITVPLTIFAIIYSWFKP